MSRTSFRVNPQSIVCLNVKELLEWRCFKMHIFHISVNRSLAGDENLITTPPHPSELLNYLISLTRVKKKPGYVNRETEKKRNAIT